ncbi:hypothetical protein GCM10027053_02780 [Intrasporangium mesophilum]
MTRIRTNLHSRSLGQLSMRPSPGPGGSVGSVGIDGFAYSAATSHPFVPAGQVPRCADEDAELFWPATVADEEAAKAICRACPLTAACLAVARERREWGVWGGQLLAKGRPTTDLPGNVRPSPHEHARTA